MGTTYEINREFADKFLPQVKDIIADEIIQVAPYVEDTQHATDLVILTSKRGQIAVRVRRSGYASKYPWEFTIRYRTANFSYNTEYKKIIEEGLCDWFFYGHVDKSDKICKWFLIDLDIFRSELIEKPDLISRGMIKTNRDKEKTQLIAFDTRWFSPELIINSSHQIPYT